jgi:predicted Ser/Thr protein kinase
MHHPVKHIIVNPKLKPVMIDFERCHIVDIAKNVTQFVDFLMRFNLLLSKYDILVDKDKIIGLLKNYKKDQTKENLRKILDELQR